MNPVVQANAVGEDPVALSAWDAPHPVRIDGVKLLVWVCAIVTPWLAIATVVAVSVHGLS